MVDEASDSEPLGQPELGNQDIGEEYSENVVDSVGPPEEVHEGASGNGEGNGTASASKETTSAPEKSMKLSRKRTKTGCLTCRRRRIKCDESRPKCNNCKKSKRDCEGYNQRVKFKDPLNNLNSSVLIGPGPGISRQLPSTGRSGVGREFSDSPWGALAASGGGPGNLPAIAPRPPDPALYTRPSQDSVNEGPSTSGPFSSGPELASRGGQHVLDEFRTRLYLQRQRQELVASQSDSEDLDQVVPASTTNVTSTEGQRGGLSSSELQDSVQKLPFPPGMSVASSNVTRWDSSIQHGQYPLETHIPFGDGSAQEVPESRVEDANIGLSEQYLKSLEAAKAYASRQASIQGIAGSQRLSFEEGEPFDEDIESFDVDSDDEMIDTTAVLGTGVTNSNFARGDGLRLVSALDRNQDMRTSRNYRSLLNEQPDLLASYNLADASPLLDKKTARVFAHFITVTGPSLSMYERCPANPSVMFSSGQVPRTQRHLWTFTLPNLAIESPPLLHAMLAVSSLHIAKLQTASTVPSFKHYHLALRQVARSVSDPSKRGDMAIFGASLLLGFWEVMAAQHSNWNSHLLGARQLLVEHDFAGLTKRIKAQNSRKEQERRRSLQMSGLNQYWEEYGYRDRSEEEYVGVDPAVDENLVSLLMGQKLSFSDYGRIIEDQFVGQGGGSGIYDAYGGLGSEEPDTELIQKDLPQSELEDYETRADLFWWYMKQDLFRTIISGNPLLLEYARWSHCPPRAPMGRADLPFGSYDHLILLGGRVADFAARDQLRKKRTMEARGYYQPPAPPDGGVPGHGSGPQRPSQTGQAGPPGGIPASRMPPPSFGMAPPGEAPEIPRGFRRREMPPNQSQSQAFTDQLELEAAGAEAEEEWKDIQKALEIYQERLGPGFQPLPSGSMQPLSTPFGPAIFYKTYPIACIWLMYHMFRIILERVHPAMPPAAMMAAGMAASKTAQSANDIGRTAAGLTPTIITGEVNPWQGAALIESSMSLFFAGVQYRDAAQRGWTVSRLWEIARLTGWESSAAIAAGCETSWEKQASMGKAPPYRRVGEPISNDSRITGRRPILLDQSISPSRSGDLEILPANPSNRVHFALGVLGVDDEMANMNINDESDADISRNLR